MRQAQEAAGEGITKKQQLDSRTVIREHDCLRAENILANHFRANRLPADIPYLQRDLHVS
jgi:hypothetical protein